MDRIIEVKVGGNYLSKDSKNAGVRGEGNVTMLRITFDEGWDGYAKTVTFWDALGNNPVKRIQGVDLIEDITKDTRTYITPIPAEPMAIAGELTFVIDGYIDGKRQRSISDKLAVKDAPITDDAGEPTDPTPTQAEQLQAEIDGIKDTIQKAVFAEQNAAKSATNARESENNAQISANIAIERAGYAKWYCDEAGAHADTAWSAVGKTSFIGDNGNWFAWDGENNAFYDTGVKAQSGSTVYYGDNPPPEADVWIDPDGDSPIFAPYIGANGNWYTFDTETQTFTDSGVQAAAWTEEDKEALKNYFDEQTAIIKADVEGLQKQINEEAHFRGYLSTNAKIQALEATPNDFAYSAESGTKWVYDAESGWMDTGAPVPDQLTPASDSTPLVNGTASAGTANEYARGDHRHPTDTTRLGVDEFNSFKADLESGLDNIIAIQNTLIGGDGE